MFLRDMNLFMDNDFVNLFGISNRRTKKYQIKK